MSIMAQFDDWNTLAHHGIKGQKWGVRRFQNEDGTLTEEGKRHIAKSGTYLNPNRRHPKRLPYDNRNRVSEKYVDEWDKKHDELYIRPHVPNDNAQKKLWDKFKDEYASATLKDLKMKDTAAARKSVQDFFSKTNWDYEYVRSDKPLTDETIDSYNKEWLKYRYSPREVRKINKLTEKASVYREKSFDKRNFDELGMPEPKDVSRARSKAYRKYAKTVNKKVRYMNRH